jgi:hypothetical protein
MSLLDPVMRQLLAQPQEPRRRQRDWLTAREERAHDVRSQIGQSNKGREAALSDSEAFGHGLDAGVRSIVKENSNINALDCLTVDKGVFEYQRVSSVCLTPPLAAERLRVNSTHSHADRGLDAYWTPPEATTALLKIESVPRSVADPACGSGAILDALKAAGHIVHGSDIADYGWRIPSCATISPDRLR